MNKNNLTIEPAKEHVALIFTEDERTSQGGIILSSEQNPIVTAQVLAVHPTEEWLCVGDIVYLRKANARDFDISFGAVKIALTSTIVARVVEAKVN